MSNCFWVRRGGNEFYGFDPPEGREKILYKMVCGQDPAAWIETHGIDGADYPEPPPNDEPDIPADDDEPEIPDDVVVIGVTDLTDAGSDDLAFPPVEERPSGPDDTLVTYQFAKTADKRRRPNLDRE